MPDSTSKTKAEENGPMYFWFFKALAKSQRRHRDKGNQHRDHSV